MSAERLNGTVNSSNDAGPGLAGSIDVVRRRSPAAGAAPDLQGLARSSPPRRGRPSRSTSSRPRARRRAATRTAATPPTASSISARGGRRATAVLNLGATTQATPALTFFARIANVLDRHYATAAQLGPTGFDSSRPLRRPAVPRRRSAPSPAAQLDLLRTRRAAPVLAGASLCVRLIPSRRRTPRRRGDAATPLPGPLFSRPCTCGSSG